MSKFARQHLCCFMHWLPCCRSSRAGCGDLGSAQLLLGVSNEKTAGIVVNCRREWRVVVSFQCRNCNQESVELSVKSRAATLCWLQSLFPARTSCWTPARGWRRGWRRPPRPPPGPGSWPRGWSAATRRRTRRRSSWRRTQRTSRSSASLRLESPPRCKQTDS